MLSRAAIMSGISAQSITKSITFYVNECVTSPGAAASHQQPRPLLLLFPWLGSRPHAVAKYCEIYFRTGFDVLVVESGISHFLWPRWGLEYGAEVLEVLQSERFAQRPLLVHAFSIGGYTFTQVLVHVSKDTQRYQSLTSRIRGHIYDSLVMGSLERMAIGISKNLFSRWEWIVKQVSLLYFRTFKRQTVDYYNTAINIFWNTPVTAPALFLFCENDALCDPQSMEELIDFWRGQGIPVESKKWAESIHAGHLRAHPQEYLSTVENFLLSLNMVPVRDIM
ncbi:uncharacterized protein LOC115826450 [Chanos chanos]|uniref:Uncharacterized protein LOC115826450 n=1 Tax=Chanos chanos TaxID=29144 RepID=A0A6J2WKT5_CHACN|nr:uncharacterized protein LOC115826450 [Chanos chanos]